MKTKLIIIITASFIVGAASGFLWASNAFKKSEISKEADVAWQTAFDASMLAMLRLGETTNAIAALEMQADGAVGTLAIWDQLGQPDAKTRALRDHLLTNIKVYHQSFPFHDDDANTVALINSFLAKIPGRSSTSTCKAAICQLDDLRMAALKTETNSAFK
jgi:hypothetical protein